MISMVCAGLTSFYELFRLNHLYLGARKGERLLKIVPYQILVIAGVIALSSMIISGSYVQQQPWLGITLAPAEQGLLVEQVDHAGPSAGILYVGDAISAIGPVYGKMIAVESDDVIDDPDMFQNFEPFNAFLSRQRELFATLKQPTIRMLLGDGRMVHIQPQPQRPLLSIPWRFWFSHLFATTVLLISMAIWGMQKKMVATQLLFISGISLFVASVLSSLYIARELAFDADMFLVLTELNSMAVRVFCVAGLGLLWYYPRPLAAWHTFLPLLATVEVLLVINEVVQWRELPFHAFYFDYLFLASLAVFLGVWRWQQAKGKPIEQAIVKWFTLPVLLGAGLTMLVFVLPVFYFGKPILSITASYMVLLLMYIGLALGVIRFRLFDIERWWIAVWSWFLAGAAVVTTDAILVGVVHLASPYALGIAIFAIGWAYFPLRQWVLLKVFHRSKGGIEDYVPLLVAHFIRLDHGADPVFWHHILQEIYKPLSLEITPRTIDTAQVLDGGERLVVPSLVSDKQVELKHADNGRRLFDRDDVKCSQMLLDIAERTFFLHQRYMQGVSNERKRIMRDLHDDIGGRLLTLVHAGHDGSRTAAEALSRLREIIYSLDVEQKMTLNTAVARWRIEALERCETAGISFEWHWQDQEQDVELSPRHFLNLLLIFREALTNVLKHTKAKSARFDLTFTNEILHISLWNNGVADCRQEKMSGKGLSNMCTRTEELGGKFGYTCEAGEFCIQAEIPLNRASEDKVSHA